MANKSTKQLRRIHIVDADSVSAILERYDRAGQHDPTVESGFSDCPVLGGKPHQANCPCIDVEFCIAQGILPKCVACARSRTCALAPTQSCSLFESIDDSDTFRHELREAARARFGRNQNAWVEQRRAL